MLEYHGDFRDSIHFKPARVSRRERIRKYARRFVRPLKDSVYFRVFCVSLTRNRREFA